MENKISRIFLRELRRAWPLTLALLYFAALALSGIFDSGKEFLLTVLGQKLTRALRSAMCAKLSRLPAAWFAGREPGAVASRFVGDVDRSGRAHV